MQQDRAAGITIDPDVMDAPVLRGQLEPQDIVFECLGAIVFDARELAGARVAPVRRDDAMRAYLVLVVAAAAAYSGNQIAVGNEAVHRTAGELLEALIVQAGRVELLENVPLRDAEEEVIWFRKLPVADVHQHLAVLDELEAR